MNIFRSLKHRNYRLFFFGQSISLIGTWMQTIAMGWLVYRMTNSPMMLGLIGFFGQMPTLFISPIAGVLVDRWNNKKALIITQIAFLIQALALSILVLFNLAHISHLLILSIILGIINSFDMPIRQAFVVEIVDDKKDLGNAIALNSTIVNGARLIGPAIAGIIIAITGEGICFLINAISYVAVIISLLMMNVLPKKLLTAGKNILFELKEGFLYVSKFTPLRNILLLLALGSLIGMPYTMLMPVFVRDVLQKGPQFLGFLMGASGFGALFGGMMLASRKNVLGLGKILATAPIILGSGLIFLSFSKSFILSIFIMLITGYGMITQIAASNTMLQTITEDDKRGRVMSFYTLAFMGTAPIGSLLAGWLSHILGVSSVFMISGLLCIIAGISFALSLPKMSKKIRPIYIQKGILAAAELTQPPED